MPVIVTASPKGGSGKTTTCIALASEINRQKVEASIIDADPNQHLYTWSKQVGISHVISSTQDNIIQDIDQAHKKSGVVIVDLEGSMNMTMAYAICKADIAIIPTQASDLDGKEVMKVAKFIINQSDIMGKEIKKAVLFTKLPTAIVSKIEKAMLQDFYNVGLDVFKTRLTEREAFKSIVSNKCFVHNLISKNTREKISHEKAVMICRQLSLEVIEKINSNKSIKTSEEYNYG